MRFNLEDGITAAKPLGIECPVSSQRSNQRRYWRAPLVAEAYVVPVVGDAGRGGRRAIAARAVDVSEGGVRLQTSLSLAVGERYQMLLNVGGELVEARGVLVHGMAERGYGLRFVQVNGNGLQAIRRYIWARGRAADLRPPPKLKPTVPIFPHG